MSSPAKNKVEYLMILFKGDKFSALVCVGEMLKEIGGCRLEEDNNFYINDRIKYYLEVKKELHNINPKNK